MAPPTIINNINLGPQSRPAPLAPRAVRISKRKMQGKKGKKAVMKTNAGVLEEARRLEEAAAREEKEAAKKRAKAKALRSGVGEKEKEEEKEEKEEELTKEMEGISMGG